MKNENLFVILRSVSDEESPKVWFNILGSEILPLRFAQGQDDIMARK